MEKNHPVSELMSETIQRIREAVDANTVVGTSIASTLSRDKSSWEEFWNAHHVSMAFVIARLLLKV